MRKHLLLTTALVAVFGISNAYAEHTSLGNLVVNDGDTINETSGSEKYYDSITINGGTVNIKNGSEIKTEKTGDVINISGGNISLDEGEIKGHSGNMNITGGTITGTNDTEIDAGITTISGNTVITLSDGASIGADSVLNINGGTFNLSSNGLINAGPYDEYEGIGLIQMTSGTINMEGAHLIADASSIDNVRDAGNIQIKGGTVNVKSGNNIIMTSDNAEVSHVSGSNAILNVSDGANLYVYEKYSRDHGTELFDRFYQKGTLNILDNATINLGGTLNSNVNNAAKFNVTSTSAKLNGNLNVNNNGVVNLGTNKLTVDGNIAFNEGSKLALVFTSKDKVGQIDAKNISINENNTTLDMSFNNAAVANSGVEVQVLNASEEFTGKFAKIAENSEYNIEDKGNGLYAISKKSSAPDEGGDDSGKEDDTPVVIPVADDAGDAWNNLDTGSIKNETTVAVADRLTYLRNHQTTVAGKQAYEDALTALAPETAPAVQQAATEGANQIFGAVGTRLSGGAVAAAKQGMSSGDNPFTKVAVWVQGLFNKAKLDDTSKSKGFDSKTYGTALGVESKISDDVKLGVGYAYSKTDIDGFMRDTDVKTHTAILYGEYKPSNWYVNAIASYGWSDYDEKKNVAGVGVKADWDVESFALQMMTGYDMYFNGFGVTPEAGLRYIHVKQDKYTDTAGQSVKSDDSDIVTGVLGAKIAKSYNLSNGMLLTPEFKAAMTYDISHDNSKSTVTLVNGSSYSVSGKPLNRFGVELGAGITAELNDNVELSLGYEGKFRKDYQDHTGLINAKYKF
ncbi:MAG: autotransporter domain-containing protein [Alphaproteobacteria bacterium]|nr:autotransporter domain-containing protein [Alphaproteobacteria bacterium]MBR2274076.1 autotransporter domain-containing protein [Alphaproteobacteria bacterium]